MPTCGEIAAALTYYVPLDLQEGYDNCGWQVGDPSKECTGVLVCVDATPERVKEAVETGCNMIVSHHPTLFSGLKSITGKSIVEETVLDAVKHGISIFALHTALDNAPAPFGVSHVLAERLGLVDIKPLDPATGTGAIGNLPEAETPAQFVSRVKQTTDSPVVRTSDPSRLHQPVKLKKIALCGGSGSSFVDKAVAAGADAYLTSDTSYHKFVDYASKIFLADIGHFESEECTKSIIESIIRKKFPNFAIHYSRESNPILYI